MPRHDSMPVPNRGSSGVSRGRGPAASSRADHWVQLQEGDWSLGVHAAPDRQNHTKRLQDVWERMSMSVEWHCWDCPVCFGTFRFVLLFGASEVLGFLVVWWSGWVWKGGLFSSNLELVGVVTELKFGGHAWSKNNLPHFWVWLL